MMEPGQYKDTPKQAEALKLMGSNKHTLLEGGGRSGKTVRIVRGIVARALHYPGTDHLMARLRLSHARASLWNKTLPDVLNSLGIRGQVELNGYDLTAFFRVKNKVSRIVVGGLDDKERTEKILGLEYATIFLNEVSQITYDTVETVMTRLNPPQGVPSRVWMDYNPPSTRHWGYKIFHERKFPDGRPVPEGDYAWLKMNPADNRENISAEYFDTLETLSLSKRIRFRDGEYGTEEGALWKRDWIKYAAAPENLLRVVVGVDPSGSAAGDEIGIIVAGIDAEGNGYTLADYSMHGSPKEWGEEVVKAYNEFGADMVAAEKNFGGDMVEAVITDMGRSNVNVKLVNASRGKAVRAEPISARYEQGKIKHAKEMPALEDELCTWKPAVDKKSPNRLDANVWAHTELSENSGSMDYVG